MYYTQINAVEMRSLRTETNQPRPDRSCTEGSWNQESANRRACMKRIMNVEEASEVCKDSPLALCSLLQGSARDMAIGPPARTDGVHGEAARGPLFPVLIFAWNCKKTSHPSSFWSPTSSLVYIEKYRFYRKIDKHKNCWKFTFEQLWWWPLFILLSNTRPVDGYRKKVC